MPILNYTTAVPPERTVGEISSLLVQKGARSITTEYSLSGDLCGISFTMEVANIPVRFALPANVEGVAIALLKDKPYRAQVRSSKATYEQKTLARARWIAWRILKDWVAAQIALIESNQAQAAQVFMPYAVDPSGATMYEIWFDSNQRQLGSGEQP